MFVCRFQLLKIIDTLTKWRLGPNEIIYPMTVVHRPLCARDIRPTLAHVNIDRLGVEIPLNGKEYTHQ